MKTYNERLNEIAEEMAKAFYELKDVSIEYQKGLIPDVIINKFKSSARIALKHMAEEWKLGYLYAHSDDLTERAGGFKIAVNEHLISLGLIEPQTT